MEEKRKEVIERLLSGYRRYYNVTRFDGGFNPPPEEFKGICEAGKLVPPVLSDEHSLVAVCEYYEKAEQYFLFKSNELWATHQEEFIFLFSVKNLTKEIFETCRDYAYKEGMKLAHIGPGHMYSYISPVFVCEMAEPEAVKALEKCKIYKSFKFSFHGWMDFHVACFEASRRKLHFNHSGLCMKKNLEKVLREELL
ncbi:MAG: hypothetical protein ABS965_03295 [Succiniclasticum sp.]